MKVKINNMVHPNTNSSNWPAKSFPCYLYISKGCDSRENYLWILHHQMLPASMRGGREGCTKQCWDGGELWWSSALRCVPSCSPHVQGALLSPLRCPEHVPPAPATRGCETFTGLIQSSHLCHAETYLKRKRPLLVCQAVYSPHCIQRLFTVVPQRLNQREQGTKTF